MRNMKRSATLIHVVPLITGLVFLATFAFESIPPLSAGAPDTGGDASPFLLRHTDVRSLVTGPVAHVTVTQTWANPNLFPVNGLYIFPLPENAAVTDMTLKIGGRTIRSLMKRREEARAIYEQARRQGRVAGLLDQERPNVFAQQVANIMPGMRIQVVLSFDHEIKCEDGGCEYAFPTVVGPRFIPMRQTDPGRIDPPVIPPGRTTGQTLSLTLDLDAGVSIHDLESPSHRVTIFRADESRAQVTLADGAGGILNKDFRLRWRLGGKAPEVGVLAWRAAGEGKEPGVFTLILQPPREVSDEEAAPRELVFVIDCSGSMNGVPIEAAKQVVRKTLKAVRAQDTFQIISFSMSASALGPRPLQPTPQNIQRAFAYLDTLHGEGGTEMISGIRAALGYPADPERLRIVAFLTDGYIGNESEILGEVRRLIREARLFSFGIGSSVNRYLLESLAEEGRGAAAFLGPRETSDQMVGRFVERIATPALTDVRITWQDLEVQDLEPGLVPDLFAGRPVIVHGRYRTPGVGAVHVDGRRRGRRVTFSRVVSLPEEAADHEALGRLWARSRIHRLEREMHDGERPDVREAITHLGLTHRLMTAWTSLVAVDSLVSNPGGAAAGVNVPVEMPEDVSYEGVFGSGDGSAALSQSGAAAGIMGGVAGGMEGGVEAGVAGGVPGGVVGGVVGGVSGGLPGLAPLQAGIGGVTYPELIPESRVQPRYPEIARKAKVAGRVILQAIVRRDGSVGDIQVLSSPGKRFGFDEAAIAAVRQWRYKPGLQNGKPVDVYWTVVVDFPLQATEPALPSFDRLILVHSDGTRIIIEQDGEVWKIEDRRRILARTLSASEIESLRGTLAQARPATWRGATSGARIVLEAEGGERSTPLASSNLSIRALIALIESWAP